MQHASIMKYIEGLVGPEDELLGQVRRRSEELSEEGVVSIDPTRGRFLELIAMVRSPRRILEVGSGVGYSALWFMKGMGRRGSLETIEINPQVAKELSAMFKKAGFSRRVKVHVGPAIPILTKLKGPYDIIFIDAEKDEYPEYLQHAMRLTRRGSLILADNMLWSGAVFTSGMNKRGTEGITTFTNRIFRDGRLSSLIIPLGDGMSLSCRVR